MVRDKSLSCFGFCHFAELVTIDWKFTFFFKRIIEKGNKNLHFEYHDDLVPLFRLPRRPFGIEKKNRIFKLFNHSMEMFHLRYLEKFEQIICSTALSYHRYNHN